MNTSRAARRSQPIEVREAFRVRLVGPIEPKLLDRGLEAGSLISDDGLMPAPTTLPAQLSIAFAA